MYLPKSKYEVRTVKPGEFTLNGKPYAGSVVTDYLGNSYAGNDIYTVKEKLQRVSGEDMYIHRVPGKRFPTDEEYAEGKMVRYFRQNLQTKKIIEMEPEAYEEESQSSEKLKYFKYRSFEWTLVGTLDPVPVGNYFLPGVRAKNQRIIDIAEQELPGIVSSHVLFDPEEFVEE